MGNAPNSGGISDDGEAEEPAELVIGADKTDFAPSFDTNTNLSEELLTSSVPEIEQIPVVFSWDLPSGNDTVYISGTFNQWSERIPLHVVQGASASEAEDSHSPSGNAHWEVTLLLSPGLYALRFIVEGKWRINPALSIRNDNLGNEFNAIFVKPPQRTSQQSGKVWTDEIPNIRGEIPKLAAGLSKSHLDFTIPDGTEPFLLPFPPNGTMQHLFLRPGDQTGVVMSSVTLRVRSKFVTSQLYQYNPDLWKYLRDSSLYKPKSKKVKKKTDSS